MILLRGEKHFKPRPQNRILVPLRGEKISSHAHKTGSWYFLAVLFKISDKHPHPFYMGVPPPKGTLISLIVNCTRLKITRNFSILYSKGTTLPCTVKFRFRV